MQSYGSMSRVMSITALSKRTVVLIGVSGSGKSTIANKLYGHEQFQRTGGATEYVRTHSEEISDTELLLETYIMDARPFSLTLNNQEPSKEYYRENLPDDISLVIFVCRHNSPPQDFESLKRVVGLFDGINGRAACALVVTCCEQLPLEDKKSEEDKYRLDPAKVYIDNRVKRVCCVGFNPNREKANETEEQACIKEILSLITRSRLTYRKETLFSQSFCEKVTSTCNIL